LVLVLLCVSVLALVYLQFRGAFTPTTQLTLLAGRAGLVMDKSAKVTFNGVEVGRVTGVELGQPLLDEYVWGRQVGEYTINP
jgi:phospholipid/cholesterol/gamma-HCH transport system substrate-binding protein